MSTRTVAETKAHLSAILDEVVDGHEVLITRRGRPVARLLPIPSPADSAFGWDALDAWLAAGPPDDHGPTVEQMRASDLL